MIRYETRRRGYGVAVAIAVLLALLLPLPVNAHTASYCGHGSAVHFDPFYYADTKHAFVQHWGAVPHEHEKDHYYDDIGTWVFLHTKTKAC